MDLEVLKIAANTDNNRNIKNRTHVSKLKNSLLLDLTWSKDVKLNFILILELLIGFEKTFAFNDDTLWVGLKANCLNFLFFIKPT